jgi:AraC-like DNA-binding protein
MRYYTIPPPPSLAAYVRYFWVLEGEASIAQPYIHHSMADGCAELLFHYNGVFDELITDKRTESSFRSGIAGQTKMTRRFVIQQNFSMFGAWLYPFAITELFAIPATAITDQMPDLRSALGNEAVELEEKIMLANDTASRVSILSGLLEKKLPRAKKQAPGIFETIQHIISTNGMTNVEELAKRNFLSTRHFERNFKNATGFNPKLFSRIIRFQSVLNNYGKENGSLTGMAYEAGYCDQSHFIHDFKQFSGHNPKAYFSGKTGATQWRD